MMTSEESPPYADDEIKTYVDEGDERDEIIKSENLSEDKKQLVGDSDEENGNSAVKVGSTENPFLPTSSDAFHFQQLYSSFLYPGLHLARFPYMYSKDKLPLPPAMPMGYPAGFAPLPPSAHPGLFPFYTPEMCRWFPAFPGSIPRSPLLPGSPAPSFMPISCLTSPSSHNSPKIPHHMMENCDASMRGPIYNPHNGLLTTEPHFFQNTSFSQQKSSPKKPTIKKPLNAFMLFMKEMRPSVIAENHLKESAAINQILGRKWHEIGRKEQQKYYDMAKKEKELHAQKHPGWSARDNYAMNSKKKKKHKLEHMDGNVSSGSESSRVSRMKNVHKPPKSLDILMSDSAST